MTRCLTVKTVFCPNQDQFNRSFDSLRSLLNLVKSSKEKTDLLVVGWIKLDTHELCLKSLINEYKDLLVNMHFVRLTINLGKHFMFRMIERYVNNNRFILVLDHDLLFDSLSLDVFDKIEDVFNETDTKPPNIAAVVLNQSEDVRHQLSALDQMSVVADNRVAYTSEDSSTVIALGGFFIKVECVDILSSFTTVAVYGLDDSIIQEGLNKRGLKTVLLLDECVVHPFDHDKNYKRWKVDMVIRLINNIDVNYFRTVELSVNLWS